MSLTDIMSAAGLSGWTEAALLICFATFVAILIYLFVVRRNRPYDHEAGLPLDDGIPEAPASTGAPCPPREKTP